MVFTKNMQIDIKVVQIKNKISNLKKKLTLEDEGGEYDGDVKLVKDEMDYLKQSIQLVKAEVLSYLI
jgi:glutaredoxin-related protein